MNRSLAHSNVVIAIGLSVFKKIACNLYACGSSQVVSISFDIVYFLAARLLDDVLNSDQ